MKFKRFVAISMAAVMMLGMVACKGTGDGSTSTAGTSASVTGQTVSDASAAEPVTLKWFIFGKKYKDSQRVYDAFNEQLKQILPNTKVDFEVIEEPDYKQRWDLKMASDEPIDLAWTGYLFSYFSEVSKGSYLPLNDLVAKYGGDMTAEIPEYMFEKQKVSGQLYSIPNYQQAWFRGNSIKMPKDLADANGDIEKIGLINRSNMYTTQECYDVFEQYLASLKDHNQIQLGISNQTFAWLADKGLECLNGEKSPYAIKIFDDDLKVHLKYELDNYKLFYKMISDWYKKGYVRKDILSIQNPRSDDAKLGGTVMWVHGYLQNQSALDSKAAGFPVVCEPLDGYKFITFDSFSTATAIPRTSKNPDRAMQLLNVMNSHMGQQPYRTLAHGFEGENFTLQDNVITVKKDSNNQPLYETTPWVIGSPMNDYETSPGLLDITMDYNENALVSPLTGFKVDTTSIQTELAQIDAVVKEYGDSLSTGAMPDWESRYNEFIDKLKKAGADTVVAEMQKQVDAFVAANKAEVKKRTDALKQAWDKQQANPQKFLYDGFYIDQK